MSRKAVASAISELVRNVPRVKGLGICISFLGDRFKNDNIQLEKVVFGNKMRLRTDDLIGRYMLFTPNYFDRRERKIIESIVCPGDYVIDVGANIGVYTLILARLVGCDGQVDAIEAEQANADELRYNLGLNSARQVTVHQVGVSDKNETLELLLNTTGNAGGHSFYEQSHIADPQVQIISCVPLSTVTRDRQPKFMKLDIEGFEHRVLRQYFDDVPRRAWPRYLMVEDNPERREADAIHHCLEKGYEKFEAVGPNVFLRLT